MSKGRPVAHSVEALELPHQNTQCQASGRLHIRPCAWALPHGLSWRHLLELSWAQQGLQLTCPPHVMREGQPLRAVSRTLGVIALLAVAPGGEVQHEVHMIAAVSASNVRTEVAALPNHAVRDGTALSHVGHTAHLSLRPTRPRCCHVLHKGERCRGHPLQGLAVPLLLGITCVHPRDLDGALGLGVLYGGLVGDVVAGGGGGSLEGGSGQLHLAWWQAPAVCHLQAPGLRVYCTDL
mmetsp:Transcript_29600/g.65546  ORF Transcript_29600/g.65546 Transcript_29600/m.65546 type:complete len:237 (-) Transcript_29600:87-797(-)